ncbi:MAG: hypothetical protein HUK04_06265, partial [Bacteroidaceae bacterium]|nr:hypothetical protein [Bacteroidaceae bacterium]
MKLYIALLVASFAYCGSANAQDDDMYFASSPKKNTARVAAQTAAPAAQQPSYRFHSVSPAADYRNNNFDVDNYNRR